MLAWYKGTTGASSNQPEWKSSLYMDCLRWLRKEKRKPKTAANTYLAASSGQRHNHPGIP